jgi:VanZ family protein
MPLGADKVAHFIEYLILAYLFYRGARDERWGRVLPAWLLVIIVCGGIGTIDELHQRFIPGRDPNIWDWVADTAGIVSGTLIGMRRFKPGERAAEKA